MTFQSQLDAIQASVENLQAQLVTIQSDLDAVGPNVVVRLTSGSSWTVPAGVTSILVEGVGGGEGGSTGGTSVGGTYSHATLTVTPGTTYAYAVGQGGVGTSSTTPNPGTDTWFDSVSTLCAGGGGGTTNPPAPSGGYHQTNNQGAAGPIWSLTSSKDADNGFGGHGGADASSTVNPTDGGTGSEWGQGFGTGGGGGNAGSSGNLCTGANGGLYGGAGGNSDTLGGDGGAGILVITYPRV